MEWIYVQLFLIVFGLWFNHTSYHNQDAIFGIVVTVIGLLWFLIDLFSHAVEGGWLG